MFDRCGRPHIHLLYNIVSVTILLGVARYGILPLAKPTELLLLPHQKVPQWIHRIAGTNIADTSHLLLGMQRAMCNRIIGARNRWSVKSALRFWGGRGPGGGRAVLRRYA